MNTRILLLVGLVWLPWYTLPAQCISGDCRNGIGILLLQNGEKYVGNFNNGKIEGLGSWYYQDGRRYTGQWVNGKRQGEGTLYSPDGQAERSGQWRNDRLQPSFSSRTSTETQRPQLPADAKAGCISGDCQNGKGTYLLSNGAIYIGDFSRGEIHGFGICYYPDGGRYQGQWAHRFPHGNGTRYYADGRKRTGYWNKGLPIDANGRFVSQADPEQYFDQTLHIQSGCLQGNCEFGQGTYAYPDGSRYVGSFRAGKPDGKGVFYYPNGDRYEGQLVRGLRHGNGRLVHENGRITSGAWYEGEPVDRPATAQGARAGCIEGDCQNGYGYYIFKDGAKFTGNFRNGRPNGHGIVQYTNGERYEGDLMDGAFHGNGTLKMTDGNDISGYWEQGVYIGSQAPLAQAPEPVSMPGFSPALPKKQGPKVWAVIIGVSSYDHMPVLRYPDDDAYRIYAFLKSPEGGGLPDEQIRILVDEDATHQRITNTMHNLFGQASRDDLVFLYFSGHGLPGAFLPIDYDGINNQLYHDEINAILARSQAKYKLCIADACHSGSLLAMRGADRDPQILTQYYENLAKAQPGTALIMSSKSDETSLESSGLRQGVFSHFLIRGLKGEADDNHDKQVSVQELYKFVYENVRAYTGRRQSPVLQGDYDPAMAISIVR